ncbi:MAG: DUF2149 domain-containing protein [Oscillospiraceae bacterium]|jgi:hypothetical protein|nr:DUF2149 domain-containing protein [Oscillospiraceae bacterium]
MLGKTGRGRFGAGRWSSGAFGVFGDEGINPMDGLSNLADVMLVLACGLMLALVINWNVDISPKSDDTRADELARETELAGGGSVELDASSQYEQIGEGVLYRDVATGKTYLVTKEQGG